jgi:hypothetical protein
MSNKLTILKSQRTAAHITTSQQANLSFLISQQDTMFVPMPLRLAPEGFAFVTYEGKIVTYNNENTIWQI